MPLLSPKFIITTSYAVVSLTAYVLLIVVIFKDKVNFNGSFFKLFLCQSFLNLYTYLNSVVTLRLPQNTCYDCSLAYLFNRTHFSGMEIFHFVHFHMAFVQYLMSLMISINRLWMMVFPMKYENHWRLLIYPSMAIVLVPAAFVTKTFLLNYSYYDYVPSMDCYAIKTTADLAPVYSAMLLVMICCTVLNGSHKNYNNKKSETNLIIYSFVGFVTEAFGATTTVLNRIATTSPPEEATWFLQMGQTLVPFFSDGLTLTPPLILILCSGHIRVALKNLLWRKSKVTKIASATNTTKQ